MEPFDVRVVDQHAGPLVLRRHFGVIEVFDNRHSQQARLHVDLVRTDRWGPDERGVYGLQFIPLGGHQNDGTGTTVLEDQVHLLQQVADAVDATRSQPQA